MKRFSISLAATFIMLAPQSVWAEETNWSGPYVGVTVGASETTTETIDSWCWAACDGPTIKLVKPTVGATIGVNQHVGSNLLVGVEADFNSGGSKSINTPSSRIADPMPVFKWTANYKWNATVRARVGVTTGKSLVYLTGGYAIAKADLSEDTQNHPPIYSHPGPFGARWSGTLPGVTYGAGLEHSLGRASLKAELLHSSYSIRSSCVADTVGPTIGRCFDDFSGDPSTISFVPSSTAIRIGVNFHF